VRVALGIVLFQLVEGVRTPALCASFAVESNEEEGTAIGAVTGG
jgi:hypothetical protein